MEEHSLENNGSTTLGNLFKLLKELIKKISLETITFSISRHEYYAMMTK
jgi:hypothetical protein